MRGVLVCKKTDSCIFSVIPAYRQAGPRKQESQTLVIAFRNPTLTQSGVPRSALYGNRCAYADQWKQFFCFCRRQFYAPHTLWKSVGSAHETMDRFTAIKVHNPRHSRIAVVHAIWIGAGHCLALQLPVNTEGAIRSRCCGNTSIDQRRKYRFAIPV